MFDIVSDYHCCPSVRFSWGVFGIIYGVVWYFHVAFCSEVCFWDKYYVYIVIVYECFNFKGPLL